MAHMGIPFSEGKNENGPHFAVRAVGIWGCFLALCLIFDPRDGGPIIVEVAVGGGARHGPTINRRRCRRKHARPGGARIA
jgi:hypothetical protein